MRRALEKTIRRVRSRLAAVRNRLVPAQQEPDPDTANRLAADAKALAGELDELQQQRVDTPTHVRAGNLSEQDKLDALPVGGRLFMDVVRMIAYRAETRMMAPVIGAQGKKPNARRLLRALLTSDANIIPEPAQHILRIQLLGLGSDACDRMLAPLIEELNATRTIYPGTQLRLVYETTADSPLDVAPLFHDVAFRLIGADDLHHQIRSGPEPVAASGVGGISHQQQVRFAERPIGYAQAQRGKQHLAAAPVYERREQFVEEGQNALVFVGRHRQEFKVAVGQLDELAAVVAQPQILVFVPPALRRQYVEDKRVDLILGRAHGGAR